MKGISFTAAAVFILLLILTACTDTDQDAVLQVRLTDTPADYDEVLIDIQDVQIHMSDMEDQGGWQSLQVNKGVYNLLDFRNGMDTLLATIELPPGTVSQMRLVLGSENRIRANGEIHGMDTPSAQQSGLKLNIHANLSAGIVYTIWIDFDAYRSVVKKGNGGYSLKPVVRTFTKATSGAISGVVSPADAMPYVMAAMNGDTMGTYAGEDGHFLLKALEEGMYSVIFKPLNTYRDTTIDNVSVTTGAVTKMDTIHFRPQ
jgi:hypothetical protein